MEKEIKEKGIFKKVFYFHNPLRSKWDRFKVEVFPITEISIIIQTRPPFLVKRWQFVKRDGTPDSLTGRGITLHLCPIHIYIEFWKTRTTSWYFSN